MLSVPEKRSFTSVWLYWKLIPVKMEKALISQGFFGGHLYCCPFMVAEAGLEPTTSGLWAAVYITFPANYRGFRAFSGSLPPLAVHWNLPRPLRADPVWVKTWVKNVVLLWVSQTGSFHRQIWTYDTFKTTLDSLFRGLRWPGFQEIFHALFSSHPPVPGIFLPLPVVSFPGSNMGQKHGSGRFLSPGAKQCPTPRCRDCTIAFRNCKSFLPKRKCRRTASSDTTQRQLSIRSNNKIPIRNERYIVTFKTPYHTCFECRIHQSSDSPWESIPRRNAYEGIWGAPVFSAAGFHRPRSTGSSDRRGYQNKDGDCKYLLWCSAFWG